MAISIWFETHEGDYHYDDYDENIVWMMAHCRGDLDKNLDDFEILRVSKYNGKSRVKDPMDDSLVPIIPYEKLDDVATEFLQEYYPPHFAFQCVKTLYGLTRQNLQRTWG